MTKKDIFPGIFFFLFSLYICFESSQLGLGNWRKPGPGFFSFWSAVAMGILGLLVLFQSCKLKEDGNKPLTGSPWNGKIICFLSLVVFGFILDTLGFLLSSFLFLAFLIKFVERKSWTTALLFSLAVALVSYGLFEICLQSQLPLGILEILGI